MAAGGGSGGAADSTFGPGAGRGWVSARGVSTGAGASTVSAKFTLARYNLRDRDPALEAVDKRIVDHLRSVQLVLKGDLDNRKEG